MRYIDKNNVVCPPGWPDRAAAALDDVTNNDVDTNDHGDVWRAYKTPLWNASNKKCWYCETEQERSDNAVDHFRPKDHYWWSAFSADNFRYSCTYCNSRRKNPETGATAGKGNTFPLLDESKKATCEADECHESPMLLDPCRAGDPGLLDFTDDGKPVPSNPPPGTPHNRAKISIDVYHLDHPDLNDKRRLLALRLIEKIKAADRIYPRCDMGDTDIDHSFDIFAGDLLKAMSNDVELSSFARRIISGYRNLPWVENLLATL